MMSKLCVSVCLFLFRIALLLCTIESYGSTHVAAFVPSPMGIRDGRREQLFAWTTKRTAADADAGGIGSDCDPIDRPTLSVRKKQERRPMRRPRHPRKYWFDIRNIDAEIRSFWDNDANVSLNDSAPLLIPNESILNHFERHDLRWAISSQGGREAVSYRLDANIMPGKWAEAIASFPVIMDQLFDKSNPKGYGLLRESPPIPPQAKRKHRVSLPRSDRSDPKTASDKKWSHNPGRKPKGYWNQDVVIKEL